MCVCVCVCVCIHWYPSHSNKQGRVVNKDKILGEGMKKYFDKGKSKNHLNTNIANTEENDSQMPDEQVQLPSLLKTK